jgi:hypothetical protein
MKARKFITAAALLMIVIGVAVPAAAAAPPDALARYAASHTQPADVIGRWLAAHPAVPAAQASPISDVASSLQLDRRAVASQPAPISDISSSLQVARDQAALGFATTKSGSGFAWQDAGLGAAATLLLVALVIGTTFVRRTRHVTA